ncbi:MAG: tryptophan--tRNA ligase [Alphaproteobacteria bacterium]|nr:tryptophan--tRNA ligase [Alphaproteobacteria bacterium]
MDIVLTGDRPTGKLHLGHYLGSLKRRVEMQNSGKYKDIYVMIADAQALTDNFDDINKVRNNISEVALDYMACGLDPNKVTIYIQSQIPELCELSFYYMNLVTVSRLQRNPTVKNEIQMRGFNTSIPVGFFTYPISQAADITAFKANLIPVGEDQLPMIEQAREIVRSFNTIYKEVLVEPKAILPDNSTCCRLPGLDGAAKMSKSLGNCIYLSDSSNDIKKKVQSMFTDPTHLRVEDPGHVENNPVFIYLDALCKDEYFAEFLPEYANLQEMKDHYTRGGLGDGKCKKFLNEILQNELKPIRERREELAKDLGYIFDTLEKGSIKAREVASKTMQEVKTAMGINYFGENKLN